MASVSTRNGLSTSTPVQDKIDSGYYSIRSSIEDSPVKNILPENGIPFLFNASPIKKLNFNHHSYVFDNEEDKVNKGVSSSKNQIKKLTFTTTEEDLSLLYYAFPHGDSCSEEICKTDCRDRHHIFSKWLDEDNSQNTFSIIGGTANQSKEAINSSKIDFLSELYQINCFSTLSYILSCLSKNDIRNVHNVCKKWREIVKSDKRASARRRKYLKLKRSSPSNDNRENRFHALNQDVYHVHQKSDVRALSEMNPMPNLLVEEPMDECPKSESFIEVGKSESKLLKCPRCYSPAKTEEITKYSCTRKLCQHEFCGICYAPYLNNHVCSIIGYPGIPKIIVGSKLSKKNLRRLKR